MLNVEEVIIRAIQDLDQAKDKIALLRAAKMEDAVDGRALSIAVTYLETCQLWLANARK